MADLEKAMDGCKEYREHTDKYSDYNVLGQSLRLICQLSKTNWDKSEDVKGLKFVVKDAIKTLNVLTEDDVPEVYPNLLKNRFTGESVLDKSLYSVTKEQQRWDRAHKDRR